MYWCGRGCAGGEYIQGVLDTKELDSARILDLKQRAHAIFCMVTGWNAGREIEHRASTSLCADQSEANARSANAIGNQDEFSARKNANVHLEGQIVPFTPVPQVQPSKKRHTQEWGDAVV
jgi:hypothetical protein